MAGDNTLSHSLTLRDGLELSLLAGKNVDGHWTQFYAFLFPMLAWLSSSLSIIGRDEALIITAASLGFFMLNGIATIRAYVVLNLLAEETRQIARHANFASAEANQFVTMKGKRMVLPLRIPIAMVAHAAGAASVIHLTWKSV